mmetsp:Transcript_6398/g.24775  ORF Transcript_6398/g.24775 Transcript_6398/m.24775 type:complete len:450 (-) Transcript_6398:1402-2751(-)
MDGEAPGEAAVCERPTAELQEVGRLRRGVGVPRGDRRRVQADQDGFPRRRAVALPAGDVLCQQGVGRRRVHAATRHGVLAGRPRVEGRVPVQAARHARAEHGGGHRRQGALGSNGAGAGVDAPAGFRGGHRVPRLGRVSAAAVPGPGAAAAAAGPGQVAGGGERGHGHDQRLAGLQEGQIHPRQGFRVCQASGGPAAGDAPGARGAQHLGRHVPAVRGREARARVPQEGCRETLRQGYPEGVHVRGVGHGEQRPDGGGDGAAVPQGRRRVWRRRGRVLGRRLLGCLHAADRRLHAGFVVYRYLTTTKKTRIHHSLGMGSPLLGTDVFIPCCMSRTDSVALTASPARHRLTTAGPSCPTTAPPSPKTRPAASIALLKSTRRSSSTPSSRSAALQYLQWRVCRSYRSSLCAIGFILLSSSRTPSAHRTPPPACSSIHVLNPATPASEGVGR